MSATLSKYDGTRTRLLNAREFHQIAGRAGRAGYDTAGTVVVQAPDHEVENLKQFAKVADDPNKRRKLVRRKPSEGMVPWSESTMTRLIDAAQEPLTSNRRVSTAMILDVVDCLLVNVSVRRSVDSGTGGSGRVADRSKPAWQNPTR
jgi:hypothetical protein